MFLVAMMFMVAAPQFARADTPDDDPRAMVDCIRRVVEEVRAHSYPELNDVEIEIKLFDSDSDYFQTRFTLTSFLFKKRLRCLMKVNRRLFANASPEDGMRAIVAHELDHALYFMARRRLRLLCLVRLISKGYTAQFERKTDVEAIARDYGDGLKAYRSWLYQHIPARKLMEKKRNYFSPEEIDAVMVALHAHPEFYELWRKHAPRSLQEINQSRSRNF